MPQVAHALDPCRKLEGGDGSTQEGCAITPPRLAGPLGATRLIGCGEGGLSIDLVDGLLAELTESLGGTSGAV